MQLQHNMGVGQNPAPSVIMYEHLWHNCSYSSLDFQTSNACIFWLTNTANELSKYQQLQRCI